MFWWNDKSFKDKIDVRQLSNEKEAEAEQELENFKKNQTKLANRLDDKIARLMDCLNITWEEAEALAEEEIINEGLYIQDKPEVVERMLIVKRESKDIAQNFIDKREEIILAKRDEQGRNSIFTWVLDTYRYN